MNLGSTVRADAIVGRVRLVDRLGRGGAGEVWRGLDRELGVAVKFARRDVKGAAEALAREAHLLAHVPHPGVILPLDQGVLPETITLPDGACQPAGTVYLVMELASGRSLRKWWPLRRVVGWYEVRALLLEILDALAAMHAAGLVHGDLKPENVLICEASDPRPGVKLGDFGGSRWRGDPAIRGGTRAYAAPEGDSSDPRADVYAVGALAFELMNSLPPFPCGRAQGVEVPPLDPAFPVPADVEPWVRRMLSFDPERRPADAGEVLAALGMRGRGGETAPLPARLLVAGTRFAVHRATPTVGRAALRAELQAALDRMLATGQPRAVVLSGNPGSGTTTLARWIGEVAAREGRARAWFATADAGPGGGLSGMVRTGLGLTETSPERLAERLSKRAGLPLDRASAAARWLMGEPIASTRRLDLARRMTSGAPAVIVLDDAHRWADAPAFLRALLARPVPALVIVTIDPLAPGEARADMDAFQTDRAVTWLEVPAMSEAELGALLASIAPFSPSGAAALVRRAGGSPLRLRTLAGLALELPDARIGRERVHLPSAPALTERDPTWRDRWVAALGGDADGWLAVTIAAALGDDVDGAEWAAARRRAGLGSRTLLLTDSWLLPPTAHGVRFVHPLARMAVEAIARESGRWSVAQRACAEALGGAETPRGLVHLAEADVGELVSTLDALEAGAAAALDRSDYQLAWRLAGQHATLLDRRGAGPGDARRDRGRILALRASFGLGMGGFRLVEQEAKSLADHAWRYRRPALQAQALRLRAMAARKLNDLWLAHALLREAESFAEGAGDAAERARALAHRATLRRQLQDIDGSRALADAARTLFAALDDGPDRQQGLADADAADGETLHLRALASGDADVGALAEGTLRSALWKFEALGNAFGIGRVTNALGECARLRDDFASAAALYRRSVDAFDGVGAPDRLTPLLNLSLVAPSLADRRLVLDEVLAELPDAVFRAMALALRLPCLTGPADAEAWNATIEELSSSALSLPAERDVANALQDAARRAGFPRGDAARGLAARVWRLAGDAASATACEEEV